ncbi:MAG: iron-sulfur binding hydrogenase [Spirochaetes bacterium]|nr:iron-sulfur binding hydrogenase [Spirochaetota bacterium]
MKVNELASKLGYEILTREHNDADIKDGYTSDLLSDVMGNASEESILITIQGHKNTLAVASQLDFPAVLICNNRTAALDMLETAEKLKIAVLRTKDNQFVSSYKVYCEIKG